MKYFHDEDDDINGADDVVFVIDHIRIQSIELEPACNGG